ncbi:MAG: Bug family tripartite tricarboxylate transporter substrate binding protein [Hyphomicrobiaceae bacterium]
MKFPGAAVAAVSILFAAAPGAQADGVADLFKSKGVKLLVSHPAGGGYDIYARFYGRHLKRFLPGEPNVVVQNMPGAAGIAMTNSMFTAQPKDGSVIGLGPGQLATNAILGAPGARYEAAKLSWIGSLNAEVATAIAWHTSPVKTAQDLYTHELVVGSGGTTDISTISPTVLKNLLGMKFKVITGYRGSAGQVLAVDRGEVAGIGGYNYGSLRSVKADWLKEKKVNILLQYAFEPHEEMPNVPTLDKLARSQEEKDVLALVFSPQKMGRAIFGPPGMPAEMLAAHRAAFDAMVKDKEALAEAQKIQLEIYRPMSGKQMEQLVADLHKSSPAVIKKAAEVIVVSGAGAAKKK